MSSPSDLGRTLPHNLEAEKVLLGAILVNQKAWSVVASSLAREDFFRDAHRRIFEALSALAVAGTALDLVTLKDELLRRGILDEVGGPAYISALTDGVPYSSNVQHYAQIVKEQAALRRVIQTSSQLLSDAYEGERRAADIASDGMRALGESSMARVGRGAVLARDAVRDYVDGVMWGGVQTRIPFGHIDLDRKFGGMKPQTLVIVAGRPSSGKTSWALGIADAVAHAKQPVAFFSREMSQRQVAANLLARWSRVSSDSFERGEATEGEYTRVSDAISHLDDRPLYIESAARTVSEIWAWCRRLKDEHGLTLAVIDYLQLLAPDVRLESREREVAGISRSLKEMAEELDLIVMALSQLRRPPEKRRDKRPHLDELRESGALEQDADLALLIFREEQYDPKPENEGIAEIIVAKNRTGPTGVSRLAFLKALAKFEDLAA